MLCANSVLMKRRYRGDNAPRKKTKFFKSFEYHFRTDNYISHLKCSHKEKWSEYNCKNNIDKAHFFDSTNNTLKTYFNKKKDILEFGIPKEIIIYIIIRLYFEESEEEHQSAKSIGLTENIIDNTSYTLVIKNTLIFKLIIKYISFGSS